MNHIIGIGEYTVSDSLLDTNQNIDGGHRYE